MLAALVPPGVVTKTLAVPALPAGVVQLTEVADVTVTPVHADPPTVMPVAPVRLVPVMVMDVPPAVGPLVGETEVTVGAATYVKKAFAVNVPPGVVTITLVNPALPLGVIQVAVVAEITLMDEHAEPPTVMLVAPVRLEPVMEMDVPPAVGPLAGEMEAIVGKPK